MLEAQLHRSEPERRVGRTSFLRSEPMVMVQMLLQHDSATDTIEELGELGALMFVDLNEGVASFRRNFLGELKLCDETSRHLRTIREQVVAAGLPMSRRRRGSVSASWGLGSWGGNGPFGSLSELRNTLAEHAHELAELRSGEREMVTNYDQCVELSHVLQACDDIFSQAQVQPRPPAIHKLRD